MRDRDSLMNAQQDVARLMRGHGLEYDAGTHVLDLVSEVGELAKLILDASGYGQRPLDQDVDFSGEVGDTVYSLLALATALDVDAEEALADALRKYEKRIRERGGPGSG